MPCRATQDGWVMVESSDKMWFTGERNGKPLQYSCLEKPMISILTVQSSNHALWYLICQWQIGTCQGHLLSVSVEIESCAAAATVDFDKAWRKFQRIARRDKKAFLSDQCKEIEENNRMRKTRDLFKKIRDTKGNISCKDGLDKGQKWYGLDRSSKC